MRYLGLLVIASSAVFGQQKPVAAGWFHRLDQDGNGQLSRTELPQRQRKNFTRIDSDGSGGISPEELQAAAQQARKRSTRPEPGDPHTVEAVRDIPYAGTENPRQALDLYLPKKRVTDTPLPVIVFVHGGGWRQGDKAGGLRRIAPYIESGNYAGISVGYRLTDEATWPAQIHDCKAAIRWVRGNAKKYQLNPDKIAVWGSSAGGHLVSVLGTSGGVRELEGKLGPHVNQSSRVTCVVNFFGPQNFLSMGDRRKIGRQSGAALHLLGREEDGLESRARSASPVTHVTKDDPPFLTAHGDEDPVVPFSQGEELDAALEKAGVPSIFIKMEGAGHGFAHPELDKRVKAFLDRHLRGIKAEISPDPIKGFGRK